MAGDAFAYVGFNQNGEARAFVRDDPKFPDDTAKLVSEWIREGRTVQRMTWADAHAAMTKR